MILGNVLDLGVPSDNTVTTAKLADSSVSLAKLTATGTKDATTFLRGDNTFASAGLSGWSEDGANNNLLPASASAGIYLGVNSATASNLLDDYEEGTWTPTFVRAGGTISNVTVNKSQYVKIGKAVYVSASTRYTGSDLTGYDIIGDGLPFTSSSSNSLGVTGGYIHDPGSGNTNYQAGIAGSHDGNTNFYLIITPGGRYFNTWRQNFYLSFGFWYTV